jgi:hypothetical protein
MERLLSMIRRAGANLLFVEDYLARHGGGGKEAATAAE